MVDKPNLQVTGVAAMGLTLTCLGLILTAYRDSVASQQIPTGTADIGRWGPIAICIGVTVVGAIASIWNGPKFYILLSLTSIAGFAASAYLMIVSLNLAGITTTLEWLVIDPIELPANCTIEEIKATEAECGFPSLMCVGNFILICAMATFVVTSWRARREVLFEREMGLA